MAADTQSIINRLRPLKEAGIIRRACVYGDAGRREMKVLVIAAQPRTAARHHQIHSQVVELLADASVPVTVRFWEDSA